jgi:hypothetical protein
MNKFDAQKNIEKYIEPGDSLIGFFYAQQPFKIWLFFLIGPFAVFSMKHLFVAVTKNGIHFHRVSLLDKFIQGDFFNYNEIEAVKIGKGMLQRPMRFKFKNGRNLKIKAQLKGVEKVAKLTDDTQKHIEANIATIQ